MSPWFNAEKRILPSKEWEKVVEAFKNQLGVNVNDQGYDIPVTKMEYQIKQWVGQGRYEKDLLDKNSPIVDVYAGIWVAVYCNIRGNNIYTPMIYSDFPINKRIVEKALHVDGLHREMGRNYEYIEKMDLVEEYKAAMPKEKLELLGKETIQCTDDNIKQIVEDLIELLGNEADLNHLDVSNVTNMGSIFFNSQFNGDISNWNVGNVTNMGAMFWASTNFDRDISGWDVSNVTNMGQMFQFAYFNSDISKWDVSNVTNMRRMFYDSQFNSDISGWDVSNVTNMRGMFEESQFNGDISNWNVSNVTDMSYMFYSCPIPEEYKPTFKD
jgi:surface protein